jgi:hypothetical protein
LHSSWTTPSSQLNFLRSGVALTALVAFVLAHCARFCFVQCQHVDVSHVASSWTRLKRRLVDAARIACKSISINLIDDDDEVDEDEMMMMMMM